MTADSDSELRAARRRASYSGSVVPAGTSKPALYAGKTPLQRLALQASLVRRLAALSGERGAPIPRSEWPGEVFDIAERNGRIR